MEELVEKGGDPSPSSQQAKQTKSKKAFNVENPSDLSSFGTFHFQNTQTKGINIKNFESKKFGFLTTGKNQESKPIKALKIQQDMSPILQVNQIQYSKADQKSDLKSSRRDVIKEQAKEFSVNSDALKGLPSNQEERQTHGSGMFKQDQHSLTTVSGRMSPKHLGKQSPRSTEKQGEAPTVIN